jgi:hypothetical protein
MTVRDRVEADDILTVIANQDRGRSWSTRWCSVRQSPDLLRGDHGQRQQSDCDQGAFHGWCMDLQVRCSRVTLGDSREAEVQKL